jgi:hypothetical protein
VMSLSCHEFCEWIDCVGDIIAHASHLVSYPTALASLTNMMRNVNVHHLAQSK